MSSRIQLPPPVLQPIPGPPRAKRRIVRGKRRLPKGRKSGTKTEVWAGTATHTPGGLKRGDLMRNKKGKIISKKRHAAGKKAFKNLCLSQKCRAFRA